MNTIHSEQKKQKNTKDNKPNAFLKFFVHLAGYGCFAILNCVRFPYCFIKKKAMQNRMINKAKSLGFPLNGQSMGELKDMRIGSFDFAHSGCGAIATFNAFSMVGRQPQMDEIVDFYERNGLICNAGFGINPTAIKKFLEKQKLSFRTYTKKMDWDAYFEVGQVAIVLYWWVGPKGCGAHYVSAERRETGVCVYNVYGNRDASYEYEDIQTFLVSGHYKRVVAVFIIDRENNTGIE